MLSGRKITVTLTGGTLKGLQPSAVHRGALYPLAVKPGWRQTHRRSPWAWLLYTGECANFM